VNWNVVAVPGSGRSVVLGEDSQLPDQGSISWDLHSVAYSLAPFTISVDRRQ